MEFKERCIFVPIDKNLLNEYVGYVMNRQNMPQLTSDDINVKYNNVEYEYEANSKLDKAFLQIINVFVIIFLSPIYVIFFIVICVLLFLNKRSTLHKVTNILNIISNEFKGFFYHYKAKEVSPSSILKEKYKGILWEDVPFFFNTTNILGYKVYVYFYDDLNLMEEDSLNRLKNEGKIAGYIQIKNFDDLETFISQNNISILNSFLTIRNIYEIEEAEYIGFDYYNGVKNVGFLCNRPQDFKQEDLSKSHGRIRSYHQLITNLCAGKRNSRFFCSNENLFFNETTFLYFEPQYYSEINEYLKNNIIQLKNKFKEIKDEFLYIPQVLEDVKGIELNEDIVEANRLNNDFYYDQLDDDRKQVLRILGGSLTPQQFYNYLSSLLDLPKISGPCLIILLERNIDVEYPFVFKIEPIPIDRGMEFFQLFFNWHFENRKKRNEGLFFSLSREEKNHEETKKGFTIEQDFESITKNFSNLPDQIIEKVNNNQQAKLANILLSVSSILKKENPELFSQIQKVINEDIAILEKPQLSRLVVDHSAKILLPEYGNQEVLLHPLSKAIYFLFLKHPEGISVKDLPLFKAELYQIYNRLSPFDNPEQAENAINALVDFRNPSFNQKCSRIRFAFRKILGDELAKLYYINGLRGGPKKIALSPAMIEIDDFLL